MGVGGAVEAVVVDILEVVMSETCDSEVSVGVSEQCGKVEVVVEFQVMLS